MLSPLFQLFLHFVEIESAGFERKTDLEYFLLAVSKARQR